MDSLLLGLNNFVECNRIACFFSLNVEVGNWGVFFGKPKNRALALRVEPLGVLSGSVGSGCGPKFQAFGLTIPNAGAGSFSPREGRAGVPFFCLSARGGRGGRACTSPAIFGPVRHPPQGPRPRVGAGLWVALAHIAGGWLRHSGRLFPRADGAQSEGRARRRQADGRGRAGVNRGNGGRRASGNRSTSRGSGCHRLRCQT